jgi:uncharacterized protein YgfB (UPF0149 family)
MTSHSDRFTQLDATLALAFIDLPVAEVHGTVAGAIASHMKTGVTPDLLKLIEPDADSSLGHYSQLNELLYDLYRETSEWLIEGKEKFDLLLPSDDEPLEIRTASVAAWARGYLLGLLHTNLFGIDQIPESGSEIARDMLQISEASAGADEEKEEDFALAELHEYLKVGAQLIFEFIYAERASKAPAQTQ